VTEAQYKEKGKEDEKVAKLERTLRGDFDMVREQIHQGIMDASATVSCEEVSDVCMNDMRCSVRMYERFSALGGNRVAMCVILLGDGDRLWVDAMSAGGSQAMFFKVNTWGEESFLQTLSAVLDKLS